MTRLVLDTNVVISALVFEGPANALVPAWQQRQFTFLVSKALLAEYIRVLHYPKFRLSLDEVRYLVDRQLLPFITPVAVGRTPRIVTADPADDHVLACALAGKADAVVTGDRHLLVLRRYRDIPIISLAELLKHPRRSP